jgi:hypothetical protein
MASPEQINTALGCWEDAHSQLERGAHHQQQEAYDIVADMVYLRLLRYKTLDELVNAYYRNEAMELVEGLVHLVGAPLNHGVAEDECFYRRYIELVRETGIVD